MSPSDKTPTYMSNYMLSHPRFIKLVLFHFTPIQSTVIWIITKCTHACRSDIIGQASSIMAEPSEISARAKVNWFTTSLWASNSIFLHVDCYQASNHLSFDAKEAHDVTISGMTIFGLLCWISWCLRMLFMDHPGWVEWWAEPSWAEPSFLAIRGKPFFNHIQQWHCWTPGCHV